MKLSKIQLTNFKNYENLELDFSTSITCFVGENGEGKTNLLDAIFYLCIGKSYFQSVEKFNRRHGEPFLRLVANFERGEKTDQIVLISKKNTPKKIEKNKVVYERVSEHLGYAPICFIAPDDSIILQGGGEFRRKFLNTTLSQINKNYLLQLIEYRRVLQQKSAILKRDVVDQALIQTYNSQLAPLGKSIFEIREAYVRELSTRVKSIYKKISREKEDLTCKYNSQLIENDFDDLLSKNQQKEIIVQRTLVGIHKDDLEFLIDDFELKKVGSQGQQKTALLALKLAEFELLTQYTKQKPILLLDDIFDKLDSGRVEQLFDYITSNFDGQLFLTDTDGKRLNDLLSQFNQKFEIFVVRNNTLQAYEI